MLGNVEEAGIWTSVDLGSDMQTSGMNAGRASYYADCIDMRLRTHSEVSPRTENAEDIRHGVKAEVTRWQGAIGGEIEQTTASALESKTSFLVLSASTESARRTVEQNTVHKSFLLDKIKLAFQKLSAAISSGMRAAMPKVSTAFQPEPMELLPSREPKKPSRPQDIQAVQQPSRAVIVQRDHCEAPQTLPPLPTVKPALSLNKPLPPIPAPDTDKRLPPLPAEGYLVVSICACMVLEDATFDF